MVRGTLKSLLIVVFAFALFNVGAIARADLKSEAVTYTVDGKDMTGYLVYDDSVAGTRPGVIVVHEWWGHDDYARERADKLAAAGYTAFALDMYGSGRLADHPKDAGAMMKEVIGNADVMKARFLAAKDVLMAHTTVNSSKMGAIGYCFGGNVILDMARAGVELDAVAAFHASLTETVPASPGSVKGKVRVFNGAADPFIKPENLAKLKDGMKTAGADFEYIDYPGVLHSFTSPGATAKGEKLNLPLKYDAAADADSWAQTMSLFEDAFN